MKQKIKKKGSIFTNLFILIAVLVVSILFFAGFQYGFGLFTNQLENSDIQIFSTNVTTVTKNTFSQVNNALGGLKWVALAIFVAMAITIFVSNFLVKAHPVFLILYILIAVVGVVFSVYVSNAYETILLGNSGIVPTLQTYGFMNYIMLNLPIFITIIAFAGAVFLFIGMSVDREAGGSII